MSIRKTLRTLFACMVLQVGVLSGVPMRPEQIRELMFQMSSPKVAHVAPEEDHDGRVDDHT
ncbi:MAG: hypothetical protein HOP16_07550 [Acidobacteria bacterium]|nr:hypothetical protein [Acidobacteriota bacterium]